MIEKERRESCFFLVFCEFRNAQWCLLRSAVLGWQKLLDTKTEIERREENYGPRRFDRVSPRCSRFVACMRHTLSRILPGLSVLLRRIPVGSWRSRYLNGEDLVSFFTRRARELGIRRGRESDRIFSSLCIVRWFGSTAFEEEIFDPVRELFQLVLITQFEGHMNCCYTVILIECPYMKIVQVYQLREFR